MKSILVADDRSELLETLEPILKHWGYRVLSTTKAEDIMPFVKESEPGLLLIGERLLCAPELNPDKATVQRINSGELPLVALQQEGAEQNRLQVAAALCPPLNLFELFAFIQRHVEKHPRQNLRLRLLLPGMYSLDDDNFILADVLSLSMHGLFFKAATKLKKNDLINVVIPLLGHSKEIEVRARVLYVVEPNAENNYMQGFGVGFEDLPEQYRENLQHFIRERFLSEVTASQNGVGEFNAERLTL